MSWKEQETRTWNSKILDALVADGLLPQTISIMAGEPSLSPYQALRRKEKKERQKKWKEEEKKSGENREASNYEKKGGERGRKLKRGKKKNYSNSNTFCLREIVFKRLFLRGPEKQVKFWIKLIQLRELLFVK